MDTATSERESYCQPTEGYDALYAINLSYSSSQPLPPPPPLEPSEHTTRKNLHADKPSHPAHVSLTHQYPRGHRRLI